MDYYVSEDDILRTKRCCYFLDTKSGTAILSFCGFVCSMIAFLAAMVIGFNGSLVYYFSFCIWLFLQAATSLLSILGIMKDKSLFIFPWICMLFFNTFISLTTSIILIFIPVEFESVKGKIALSFATDPRDIDIFANDWWIIVILLGLLFCYAYWCYTTYAYFEYVHYVECEDLYQRKVIEHSSEISQYSYHVLN